MDINCPFLPKYNNSYISLDDVKLIINNYGFNYDEITLKDYTICYASDKMMGFLSDCLTLKIHIIVEGQQKLFSFFIKAISKNSGKATMVKELKLFEKELYFYSIIKEKLYLPDLKPWSCKFVATLQNAIVFENLQDLQYKSRNVHDRFDMEHTLQALKTLARFHASSIIYENKKSKELHRTYTIIDDMKQLLDRAGYHENNPWFIQCNKGTLEAIKIFSKYNSDKKLMDLVRSNWDYIWNTSLRASDYCPEELNVICHCDLWNNNIMFHYNWVRENVFQPDDCVFVDFQAISYQPPACDVMLLLYCNLDPKFRENNMNTFLNYYYNELEHNLVTHEIIIETLIPKEKFMISAEKQRIWGLIVCACLIPTFWLDPDMTTTIFSDIKNFSDIMTKDKASFIKKIMLENKNYKDTVMQIYEEIIEVCCLININSS